ncbi:hypothetical protein FOCC_FOCC017722 [Frankliniella occidentalis]|nr:hypothetical protein FOCC_FOCC017722 [Frankliniella occidentalis]
MEVRWSSCYRMLESIRDGYADVTTILQRRNDSEKLDDIPLDLLSDVVDLLMPLKLETDRAQANNCVTASLPLVSYHNLRQAYSQQDDDSDTTRVSGSGPVDDEVRGYLNKPLGIDFDESKPLAWWTRRADRFPQLARLARRYLCVAATSAETERTFSDAGRILNKRRKSLNLGVVDDLIFLHMNCKGKIRDRLQRKRRAEPGGVD